MAGCLIQLLSVVDQTDQRPRRGDLGEQAEHAQAHQEPVGPGTLPPAIPKPPATLVPAVPGVLPAIRASAGTVDAGPANDRSNSDSTPDICVTRQSGLGVRPTARGPSCQSRLTPEHQHGALPGGYQIHRAIEFLTFACTSPQPRRRVRHAATLGLVGGSGNTLNAAYSPAYSRQFVELVTEFLSVVQPCMCWPQALLVLITTRWLTDGSSVPACSATM